MTDLSISKGTELTPESITPAELSAFRIGLLHWYDKHGRELPWRGTRDPYRIWVSEIILQQTQTVQAWDYYLRFIDRLPDVKSLAEAPEDELMLLWQGLYDLPALRRCGQGGQLSLQDHSG